MPRFNFHTPFPDDLDRLSPKGVYSVGELGCTRELVALSQAGKNQDCLAMAFGLGGEIYGIAGSYRQWKGAAQLWAVFDDRADRYPLALYKTCCILISYAQQKQELRRVSLTVQSGYTNGNRFAEALGFAFEGRMVGYLPDGSDANLYARLF